ncbi:TAXI family TRAP transporter solute-binding subunit [Saccharospirillum sp. HFRX-1]|uniref:TAXI family TRAP transporter solute-binding subunit n=1 Tax=unclassified Saccharospirillum TaxID=2633430 RepID=UPI003724420A
MFTTAPKRLGFLARIILGTGLFLASLSSQLMADDDYQWPRYFNIVTPNVGTANHSLSVAWASEFSAQTSSRSRVLPAPNGYSRVTWLNTGEGRLAMFQASDYFDHMDGVDGFATPNAGPVDTRLVNVNMITPWGYVVRGDSDIKTINDIGPGTRIAYAASSSFLLTGIDALLAYLDLDPSEVTLVEVGNYGANTAIIAEGRADVAFTSPHSGPSYEAAAGPHGIRWLALPAPEEDPEAFARYRALHPGYVARETQSGVPSARGVVMDHAFQANHVLADEDPEFVYQLVKWMDEQHDAYKDDYTYAYMMSIDSLVQFLELGALQPLHEGAIRYLQEKGLWTDAFQRRQDQLVAMAQQREALYKETMAEARAEGMTVSPADEDWMAFWMQTRDQQSDGRSYGEMVLSLQP